MMLALWLGLAHADVPALRDGGWALDLGQAQLSAAGPVGGLRLGVSAHTAGWSPELQVGGRWPLVEGPWTCEALWAGGALLPWRTPALVVTGTAGLRGSRRGERLGWEGLLLAPLAAELAPSRVLRAPLRAETRASVRAGPVWLSGRASFGASWVTGGLRSTDAELGLGLSWTWPGAG